MTETDTPTAVPMAELTAVPMVEPAAVPMAEQTDVLTVVVHMAVARIQVEGPKKVYTEGKRFAYIQDYNWRKIEGINDKEDTPKLT